MKRLFILLPVVLVIMGAVFFARHLAVTSPPSFDEVLRSLDEVPNELPGVGGHYGTGGEVQKETLVDLLNPFEPKGSNRRWLSEYENCRTGKPMTVFVEGRGNRIWLVAIDAPRDPKFAEEIRQFLIRRHPKLGPLISFTMP